MYLPLSVHKTCVSSSFLHWIKQLLWDAVICKSLVNLQAILPVLCSAEIKPKEAHALMNSEVLVVVRARTFLVLGLQ